MRNINIQFQDKKLEDNPVELVERKGIGHPDSICDGIAEAVSRELSKEYVKRFGRVLHHNTDQVELVGGEANPTYAGGEIIKPMYILLNGRATTYIGTERIPIHKIAISAAKNYIKDNFPDISENDTIIDSRIGQGSSDLCHVFEDGGIPKSNDTSFGCGFAPFSLTEKLVYGIEKHINRGNTGKKIMKEIGEDIKVMGLRTGDEITITIAAPAVSKYVSDMDHYMSVMDDLKNNIKDFVAGLTDKQVNLYLNTGDDYESKSIYLTVSGTSSEQGDDGSVGRGNRANGLITPFRPMSMEATSGKNPINHVGKIYNLLSNKIAQDIADAGAQQVYVRIMSQIGKPIDQPLIASIQMVGDRAVESKAREITDYWLENVTGITDMCIRGEIDTF